MRKGVKLSSGHDVCSCARFAVDSYCKLVLMLRYLLFFHVVPCSILCGFYFNTDRFFLDKHIRQGTLDKLWNKQSGAVQMLLSILEVCAKLQLL